jgi:hypothetical protein
VFDAPLPGSGKRSQDFLLTPDSGFVPLVVPESSTLSLMALGLLGAGGMLRPRKVR